MYLMPAATNLVLAALLLLGIVADVHADPFEVVSGEVNLSGIQLPKKLSELDGWSGIRISASIKAPGYCQLHFPASFGFKKRNELAVLVRLGSSSSLMNDLGCFLLAREAAFNQLRNLAIECQDPDAARLLLKRKYVLAFHLDGALSEEFPIEYQLPVLERFESIDTLLDADTEDYLSRYICMRADYRGMSKRIRALVDRLEERELRQFASRFRRDCSL